MNKYSISFLILLIMSSSANADLTMIEIYSNDLTQLSQSYRFHPPFSKESTAYLELGDNLDGQLVKLISSDTDEFRVHIQYETSLTVMDEGPHLDLIDWKHCTTEWLPAAESSSNIFTLPQESQANLDCFPSVTPNEIRDAVLKYGGERWASLLKDNVNINTYPLATAVSSIRIRVQRLSGKKWVQDALISVKVPMGCREENKDWDDNAWLYFPGRLYLSRKAYYPG